jgi:PAS domain-containing protein
MLSVQAFPPPRDRRNAAGSGDSTWSRRKGEPAKEPADPMPARLQALKELTQALRELPGTGAMCRNALQAAGRVTDARAGGIMVLHASRLPRVRAHWGFSDQELGDFTATLAEARSQAVWTPRLIPDLEGDRRLARVRSRLHRQSIGAVGFIPMVADRRSQGTLVLCYDQPHEFRPDELTVLESLATLAAHAIRHRRLTRALRLERRAVNRGPTVIFIRHGTPEWPIEFVSANVEAVFGWRPAELARQRAAYVDLIHPEDRSQVQATWLEQSTRRVGAYEQEYHLLDANGWPHLVREYVVFDQGGSAPRVHGHVRELLTPGGPASAPEAPPGSVSRGPLPRQLLQVLTEPLHRLTTLPEQLAAEAGLGLPTAAIRTLQQLEGEADRLATALPALAECAEWGDRPLLRQRSDLVALSQQVWQELEPMRGGRAVVLYTTDLPPAMGDPALLRQALTDLLQAAISATAHARTGLVRILGETEGEMARYDILPSGAAAEEGRSWEARDRRDPPWANGLGFLVAEWIVARHGGRLWTAATSQGGRSCHFTLPVARLG